MDFLSLTPIWLWVSCGINIPGSELFELIVVFNITLLNAFSRCICHGHGTTGRSLKHHCSTPCTYILQTGEGMAWLYLPFFLLVETLSVGFIYFCFTKYIWQTSSWESLGDNIERSLLLCTVGYVQLYTVYLSGVLTILAKLPWETMTASTFRVEHRRFWIQNNILYTILYQSQTITTSNHSSWRRTQTRLNSRIMNLHIALLTSLMSMSIHVFL